MSQMNRKEDQPISYSDQLQVLIEYRDDKCTSNDIEMEDGGIVPSTQNVGQKPRVSKHGGIEQSRWAGRGRQEMHKHQEQRSDHEKLAEFNKVKVFFKIWSTELICSAENEELDSISCRSVSILDFLLNLWFIFTSRILFRATSTSPASLFHIYTFREYLLNRNTGSPTPPPPHLAQDSQLRSQTIRQGTTAPSHGNPLGTAQGNTLTGGTRRTTPRGGLSNSQWAT